MENLLEICLINPKFVIREFSQKANEFIRNERQGCIDRTDYILDITVYVTLKAAELRYWYKNIGRGLKHA